MRVIPMLIFFIAALITIRSAAGQSNTVLYIYPLGSSNTGSTQSVTIGTTIVFSCTIPGLSAYTGTGVFSYTELHAMVGGVDTVICWATATGTCAPGSQGAPYTSRTISVTVPKTVGTSFRMTAAAVNDSVSYYCKIVAGYVNYVPVTGVTTPLQVYAVANQPNLSFVNSSNAFVSGQALPNITCSANVGAPFGWLQLTANGFIGTSSTAPYPSYLTLVSNSTVLQSDGTYTMTYTFGYSSGTYTLSNSNNNDYFVCYAYNSYVYQYVTQSGVASVALTIQFQSTKSTSITTTTGMTDAEQTYMSAGAIAGIVSGIVVVITLVIVLSVWCTRCPPQSMRNRRATEALPSQQDLQLSTLPSEQHPRVANSDAPDEVHRRYRGRIDDRGATGASVSSQSTMMNENMTLYIRTEAARARKWYTVMDNRI